MNNGVIKFFSLVALVAAVITTQGCYGSGYTTTGPYGTTTSRSAVGPLGGGSSTSQTSVATVDTAGYQACVAAFTADNDRYASCDGDGTTCNNLQYTQVQIMDACMLRAGPLNGTSFGMMSFGQFMPMYASGYFNGISGYDMQRQQVLYGPQIPNAGMATGGTYVRPEPTTPLATMSDAELQAEVDRRHPSALADASDDALEAEVVRRHQALVERCRHTPNAGECSALRRSTRR